MSPNASEKRGFPVQNKAFVDIYFADDCDMHRSHTIIIVFFNKDPIIWYSKPKNTVESSTLGYNFFYSGQRRICCDKCATN